MNKKISTLLTAGLLMVGALLGSANAAPTAEAAKGDLQNGAKFYLQVILLSKMLLCLKLLIMPTMQLVTFLRLH